MMDEGDPRATLPTSTIKHNIKLDEAITKNEPPDRNAPGWERRFLATLYSTWRGLFERH
jgi:hypothetical protein